MSGDHQQVESLENSILQRAEELAEQMLHKARTRSDNLLRETTDRLSLSEERETTSSRAEAERAQRRQVQAEELKQQARLDRLRWELVQAVQSRLTERMQMLRDREDEYLDWLSAMLAEGAALLPDGELLAEVNQADHTLLSDRWEQLVAQVAPGRSIRLSEQPTWGSGGVRLRNADNTAQIDNRFEGRLARYEQAIQRVILERLFLGEAVNNRTA
jgi:V/A-type H+/Na+-transporting ATPase subunit E